jgi:hypothetical protein
LKEVISFLEENVDIPERDPLNLGLISDTFEVRKGGRTSGALETRVTNGGAIFLINCFSKSAL